MTPSPKAAGKVLRIGVVQQNAIIEERELAPGESASIGSGRAASFTVAGAGLPAALPLFVYEGGGYQLHVSAGLEGRIQLGRAKAKTLSALRIAGLLMPNGDGERLALGQDSRGKVSVAGVTVLFQFRHPTLTVPTRDLDEDGGQRPLPPGLRGAFFQDLDLQFVGILLLVALGQLGFILYLRSLTYPAPASIDQLAPPYQRLIMPARFAPKAPPVGHDPAADGPRPQGGEGPAQPGEAAMAKITHKGRLRVYGAKAQGRGARAEGAITGGAKGREAPARSAPGPGSPRSDDGSSGSQIHRVVARQREALRRCYARALRRKRKLAGEMVINFEIMETGRASRVAIDDRVGSYALRSCVIGCVKHWRFRPQKGGSVFVSYTLVFSPAR